MAYMHHVMDSFFSVGGSEAVFRREVMRLSAANDEAAVIEGKRAGSWKKSSYYQIRMITSATRSGDRIIFDSRLPDPAIVLESKAPRQGRQSARKRLLISTSDSSSRRQARAGVPASDAKEKGHAALEEAP